MATTPSSGSSYHSNQKKGRKEMDGDDKGSRCVADVSQAPGMSFVLFLLSFISIIFYFTNNYPYIRNSNKRPPSQRNTICST